jgi:hypothetical protein
MPVIPVLGSWRQEDHGFKASLGYIPRPSQNTFIIAFSVVKKSGFSHRDNLMAEDGF